jgi:hypothetical protein
MAMMFHRQLCFTLNNGTHALQLRVATRGRTNIGELKIAFDGVNSHNASVDVMM